MGEGVVNGDGMSVAAKVSNEIVRTMKELYGKGPTQAKTYLCDEYIFCVMSGGLTRNEETLVRGGEKELVGAFRLRFQSLISPEISRRVETVVGRKVLSYHSQ